MGSISIPIEIIDTTKTLFIRRPPFSRDDKASTSPLNFTISWTKSEFFDWILGLFLTVFGYREGLMVVCGLKF